MPKCLPMLDLNPLLGTPLGDMHGTFATARIRNFLSFDFLIEAFEVGLTLAKR